MRPEVQYSVPRAAIGPLESAAANRPLGLCRQTTRARLPTIYRWLRNVRLDESVDRLRDASDCWDARDFSTTTSSQAAGRHGTNPGASARLLQLLPRSEEHTS